MIEKVSIRVNGMTCALCSIKIEDGLSALEGVLKASVNYAAEKAILEFDNEKIQIPGIKKKIESLGFRTEQEEGTGAQEESYNDLEKRTLKRLFIASAIFSSPLILAMILGGLGFCHDYYFPDSKSGFSAFMDYIRYKTLILHDWRLQLAAATPVQFIVGYRFYRNAFYALKSGTANMDLLVALGTTATYFYSLYVSLFNRAAYTIGMLNIYFEASTVIITLVLLGKYLEAAAKGKTGKAIRALLELRPKTARVIRNGTETDIPAENVAVGDIVIVRPGEKVPVDGVIVEGFSAIDESMLTGESFPVDKKKNDEVTGASLNKFGTFKFRAVKVGEETALAGIIRMVEEAQGSKAPIQKIADRVCGVFIPFVLFTALATFLFWFLAIFDHKIFLIDKPILYAVAVLVVSCPCALGLATPAAIMVGMEAGAQKGILIRNGEKLEKACRINTVVLDKTGTLTLGNPEVTDIIILDKDESFLKKDYILFLAACAEKNSEHPLGSAICKKAFALIGPDIDDPEVFEAIPGKGVYAEVKGKSVLVGTRLLMEENGIAIDDIHKKALAALREEGKTVVLAAVDGCLKALIALCDKVKENAEDAVASLEKMGIEVHMLTGDSRKAALLAAEKIGIKKVIADVLPDKKAEVVTGLKKQGRVVAMVGDGINDAPALAAADIGFAVGSGTDVAIETGDIILLKDSLMALPDSIRLARRTMRKIKQNLFWAFIYNLIGIPVAAAGHLNPVLAAAAMCFSSISVLLNSLSLKRFKQYSI